MTGLMLCANGRLVDTLIKVESHVLESMTHEAGNKNMDVVQLDLVRSDVVPITLDSEAIVDVQHLFRPAHLQMLSNILKETAVRKKADCLQTRKQKMTA